MGKGDRQRVSQGEDAMFEDAPVNTGAVQWPDVDSAFCDGTKDADQTAPLGGEDPARRFDDLYVRHEAPV